MLSNYSGLINIMSRITIADLSTTTQITALSDTELTDTKGGCFSSCGGGYDFEDTGHSGYGKKNKSGFGKSGFGKKGKKGKYGGYGCH